MNIATNITQLIGNTPMVQLNHIHPGIYAKCEFMNPTSSIKDRAAKSMIADAIAKGAINHETTLIEPTSGNTGIALAAICASLKIKLILTMPESMSIERRKLLVALGAHIELTPKELGMNGAVAKAVELQTQIPNALILQQFENPANPSAHHNTTALEILQDTEGKFDMFVSSVGTGGTITGVGNTLKAQMEHIRIIAVEPSDSPVLSGGKAGAHKIQGIGAGFIPKILDTTVYDAVVTVTNDEAIEMAKRLSLKEGLLVGISAGANVAACMKLLEVEENRGKKIVTILPDTAERYLSTDLFGD